MSNGITKGQERDMFRQIEELFAKVDRMDKRINELEKENKALKVELKIKQKIGKFRSDAGAEIYAIIRSCINTYKKQNINVYEALIKAFDNAPIIA